MKAKKSFPTFLTTLAHHSILELRPGIWRAFLGYVWVLASLLKWPRGRATVLECAERALCLQFAGAASRGAAAPGDEHADRWEPLQVDLIKSTGLMGRRTGPWEKRREPGGLSSLLSNYLKIYLTNNVGSHWTVISINISKNIALDINQKNPLPNLKRG